MATGNAKRDQNYVTTLIGVDMTTGIIPTPVYVDEATNRLLVSAVITSMPAIGTTAAAYNTKIDDTTTTNMIYIGKAVPTGSVIATSDPVWQIQRLDISTLALDGKWAEGSILFDQIWDDRATTITYK